MANQDQRSYDIQAILQEMRDEYWRSLEETEQTSTSEIREFVIFRLGNERYGIATGSAREVLRLPRLVPVPRLPAQIRGIINLRGLILAVTDLRPLLGLQSGELPARPQLIVAEAAGLTTALLTEGVEGIRSIAVDTIEPITEGLAGFPREAALGHVATDQGLLILLDLEHILARDEFIIDQKGGAA